MIQVRELEDAASLTEFPFLSYPTDGMMVTFTNIQIKFIFQNITTTETKIELKQKQNCVLGMNLLKLLKLNAFTFA